MVRSRKSAVSRTDRVRQPCTDIPHQWSAGLNGSRARCGLRPKRPQNAAGIRIEPAPSEAVAAPTSPAATAAPLPPDEPPVLRPGPQGLRVTPQRSDSVKPQIASSGSAVLPTITPPAARRRRTSGPSAAAGSSKALLPNPVTTPSTSSTSLTASGTPRRGRSGSRARSAPSASSRARSASTAVNAFRAGLRRSMRSRQTSVSSREETSPSRISFAWRAMPANASSVGSTARSYGVPGARQSPACR